MDSVYRHDEEVFAVSHDIIELLILSSARAPKRRARFNLHRSDDDLLHEMIIAFRGDSLNMPHRHVGKSESLHVIEGALEIVMFDDDGHQTRRVMLSAPDGYRLPAIFRMDAPVWHTVIPLEDIVVVHEVTNGPFVRGQNMEIPLWAPKEDDLAAWVKGLGVVST